MIKILFICTGNICRSPTAEAILRDLVAKEGLQDKITVASAGTDGYHEGQKADARAIKIAKEKGIVMDGHRARAMQDSDFFEYDVMYAMDGGHLYELQQRTMPGAKARLAMFLSPKDAHDVVEVTDPWYGDEDGFRDCYALIEKGCSDLLVQLKETYKL